MQTNMMSQSSCGSTFEPVDLCDRFQGALIGLRLASTAITLDQPSSQSLLHRAIERVANDGIEQIKAFAIAPSSWKLNIACLSNSACWLPVCIPMLLRYHHDGQQRLAMLSKLLAYQLSEHQGDRALGDVDAVGANQDKIAKKELAVESVQRSIAQILLLGDVLEAISGGALPLAPTDWLRWLGKCSSRYSAVLSVRAHYEIALAAIAENVQIAYPTSYLAIRNADKSHCAFAAGISSALLHPESYLLAVRGLLAERGLAGNDLDGLNGLNGLNGSLANSAANSLTEDLLSAGDLAAVCLSVCVAGFLSGALGGRRMLPALWQLPLSVERDLASELFRQWTGQQLIESTDYACR